jgi:hypothetical protein
MPSKFDLAINDEREKEVNDEREKAVEYSTAKLLLQAKQKLKKYQTKTKS